MDKKPDAPLFVGSQSWIQLRACHFHSVGYSGAELHGTCVLWAQPGDFDLAFSSAVTCGVMRVYLFDCARS